MNMERRGGPQTDVVMVAAFRNGIVTPPRPASGCLVNGYPGARVGGACDLEAGACGKSAILLRRSLPSSEQGQHHDVERLRPVALPAWGNLRLYEEQPRPVRGAAPHGGEDLRGRRVRPVVD